MNDLTQQQWKLLKIFAQNNQIPTTPAMIEAVLGQIDPLTKDIAILHSGGFITATLLDCGVKSRHTPNNRSVVFCGGNITPLGLGFYRFQMQVIDGNYN